MNKSVKNIVISVISVLLFSLTSYANEDLDKGIKLYYNKEYNSAIDIFKKAVSSDPTNPEPHLWLSKCYESLFDISKFNYELNFYTKLKNKILKDDSNLDQNKIEVIKDEDESKIDAKASEININELSLKGNSKPVNINEAPIKSNDNLIPLNIKGNKFEAPVKENTKKLNIIKHNEISLWAADVEAIAISSDNKYLAYSTGGSTTLNHEEPQKVFLYDIDKEKEITSFEIKSNFIVKAIQFSKDNKFIFFNFFEKTKVKSASFGSKVNTFVKVWSLQSKSEVKKYLVATPNDSLLDCMELNADNSNLSILTGTSNYLNGIIRVFDTKNNFKKIKEINFGERNPAPAAEYMKYSNNGQILTVRDAKGLRLYETDLYEAYTQIADDSFTIRFDYSPNDKEIATIDNLGNIRIWGTESGKLLNKIDNKNRDFYYANGAWLRVKYNPNGKFLALSKPLHSDDSIISFIDLASLTEIKSFKIPIKSKHILFSKDGKYLITAGNNYSKNFINIWKVQFD